MAEEYISMWFTSDGKISFARLVSESRIRTWDLASNKVIGERNETGIKAIRKLLANGAVYGTRPDYGTGAPLKTHNLVPEDEAMKYLGVV